MNKNEVIEILKELPKRIAAVILPADRFFDYKEALIYAISHLEEDRWIPVSERLPEYSEDVIVYDGEDMFVAWCGAYNRWHSSDDKLDKNTSITHWRPLPKAPESEDK